MSERDPDSFLQRWSRLKARGGEGVVPEAESGQAVEPPREVPPASVETRPPASGAKPVAAQVQLPDLDTLDGDSDYSAFLTPGVDALLRRRALRKLFHSPKFNVLDGLDDYMGDFTKFEPLGDLVTADMRHRIERAAQRVIDALEEPQDPAPAAQAAASEQPSQVAEDPPNDEPADTA